MAVQTKGKCKYCGKTYTKSYMLRHLADCKERKPLTADSKKCKYYELAIYGRYDPFSFDTLTIQNTWKEHVKCLLLRVRFYRQKRLLQILNNIIRMFRANRQTDGIGGNALFF